MKLAIMDAIIDYQVYVRCQIQWTPTGSNMDNFGIIQDNCSGLKHTHYLQTYELIMIQENIVRVCAMYHTVLLDAASLQAYRQPGDRQLPNILSAPHFQAQNHTNAIISGSAQQQLVRIILSHIWKLQISASILFILYPESSDFIN